MGAELNPVNSADVPGVSPTPAYGAPVAFHETGRC